MLTLASTHLLISISPSMNVHRHKSKICPSDNSWIWIVLSLVLCHLTVCILSSLLFNWIFGWMALCVGLTRTVCITIHIFFCFRPFMLGLGLSCLELNSIWVLSLLMRTPERNRVGLSMGLRVYWWSSNPIPTAPPLNSFLLTFIFS